MTDEILLADPSDIAPISIVEEMKTSYLDYAMSVIVARALPDIRDGLKPVHRRILFSANESGFAWNRPYRKSARIVGDVIGKYHPHGDTAIYDALARMTQDWSMRAPLIDGQGNFGSMDPDPPAAMRYTEARLAKIADYLLDDLDKDTVDFQPNYDGSESEPQVLPARFPNLLVNGAGGIAVGMATNIPPHNLGELCAATIALIENPHLQDKSLLKHVKGPDFPTGGILVEDPAAIAEAYKTGRGSFRVRARWEKEEGSRGAYQIIVTEIPYQVQKSKLIERIAELLEQKKLPLLDDIHDESAEDIRIVLTPKTRTVEPEMLMESLFRHSDLETRISLNMNVLDKGLVPKVMSLKEVLTAFADHRREVLERRSKFRLDKIAARLELLEGYLIAFLNLDKVIKIIRTEDEPKPVLIKTFKLTENQAEAILNMRLRSLRKLEEMEIRGEHADLTKERKELTRLLGSEELKSKKLIEELEAVDEKFGLKTALGKRRTKIAAAAHVAEMSALAEEAAAAANAVEREPITIVLSQKGWLRALKGHQEPSDAVKYREGDRGRFWIHAQTTDQIMMFATDGRFFTLDGSKLPGGRGNGEAIRTFIDLPPEADIVTVFVHVPGRKLLLAATSGHGFITSEDDAVAMTRSGKKVMNVKPGIEATTCRPVSGDQVAVVGENRKLLIFPLDQVPELGRGQGVFLQKYKDGVLIDATGFTWKEGLKDENGRSFAPSELKEWRGERAQAGRIVPRGWAKSGKFGEN